LVFKGSYPLRDCQVKDWKKGSPPHKTICGNTAALSELFMGDSSAEKAKEDDNSTKDNKRFGLPKPGYTRSPALLHQISKLEELPDVDYVFIRPYPEPDHGVKFANVMGSLSFPCC
jgi:hypothetical protein